MYWNLTFSCVIVTCYKYSHNIQIFTHKSKLEPIVFVASRELETKSVTMSAAVVSTSLSKLNKTRNLFHGEFSVTQFYPINYVQFYVQFFTAKWWCSPHHSPVGRQYYSIAEGAINTFVCVGNTENIIYPLVLLWAN